MKEKKRFSDYNEKQKSLQTHIENLILPEPPGLPLAASLGRMLSIPPFAYLDRFHNAELWASNASVQYARIIASRLPNVATSIMFAEYSLAANKESMHELKEAVSLRNNNAAIFTVSEVPNTTHASFDKRSFVHNQLMPVLTKL